MSQIPTGVLQLHHSEFILFHRNWILPQRQMLRGGGGVDQQVNVGEPFQVCKLEEEKMVQVPEPSPNSPGHAVTILRVILSDLIK